MTEDNPTLPIDINPDSLPSVGVNQQNPAQPIVPQQSPLPTPPPKKPFPIKKIAVGITILIIGIVLVGGGFLLHQKSTNSNSTQNKAETNIQASTSSALSKTKEQTKEKSNEINIPNGFVSLQPQCTEDSACPFKIAYPKDWVIEKAINYSGGTEIKLHHVYENAIVVPSVSFTYYDKYKSSKLKYPEQTSKYDLGEFYKLDVKWDPNDKFETFSIQGHKAYKLYFNNKFGMVLVQTSNDGTAVAIIFSGADYDKYAPVYNQIIDTISF